MTAPDEGTKRGTDHGLSSDSSWWKDRRMRQTYFYFQTQAVRVAKQMDNTLKNNKTKPSDTECQQGTAAPCVTQSPLGSPGHKRWVYRNSEDIMKAGTWCRDPVTTRDTSHPTGSGSSTASCKHTAQKAVMAQEPGLLPPPTQADDPDRVLGSWMWPSHALAACRHREQASR